MSMFVTAFRFSTRSILLTKLLLQVLSNAKVNENSFEMNTSAFNNSNSNNSSSTAACSNYLKVNEKKKIVIHNNINL
jgi:hypothetical protein